MGVKQAVVRISLLSAFMCFTACSSGGAPAAPPAPQRTLAPLAIATATLTAGAPSTTALPPVAGYAVTVTLGALEGSGAPMSAVITCGTAVPPGVPATSANVAITFSLPAASSSAFAPLVYLSITPSADGYFDGVTSIALTLPAGTSPAPVYSLATIMPGGFFANDTALGGAWSPWAGPKPATNGAVAFTGSPAALRAYAGQPILFALYPGGVAP
jgi:hypothetical protein